MDDQTFFLIFRHFFNRSTAKNILQSTYQLLYSYCNASKVTNLLGKEYIEAIYLCDGIYQSNLPVWRNISKQFTCVTE